MSRTLSTGLNKSEEFIRTNAMKIHVRDLTFNSNEKIILTEDTFHMEKITLNAIYNV